MPQKGVSNNPHGRPPKGRALAERIEKALAKLETGKDGKRHKRSELIADIWVSALLTGKIELPNGVTMTLPPREWFELGKFLAVHVDGSKAEIGGAGGGALRVVIEYADSQGNTAEPAPGPAADQAGA